jgi:hypothetical protein
MHVLDLVNSKLFHYILRTENYCYEIGPNMLLDVQSFSYPRREGVWGD